VIKLAMFVHRKEGMPVDEFQAYWRDTHGPLAARIPGLRRYIQCHVVSESYEDSETPSFDGAAQLWFDSLDVLDDARASAEWNATAADGANCFADGGTRSLIAQEVPIIDALSSSTERQGMIKRMGFLVRRDGMTPAEFQHHWREVHAPLVVQGLTQMRRYVQAHPLLDLYGTEREPAFDGIAESWWDGHDNDQLAASYRPDGRQQSNAPAVDDLANFAAPSRLRPIVTREVVVLDET
jgi:uncharacterized protein (TIGR02118 family)